MALKLPTEIDSTGVDVEYWKVTKLELDTFTNKVTVTLSAFGSQELRLAGKSPSNESLSFSADSILQEEITNAEIGLTLREALTKAAYLKLKEKAEEEAAKDDEVPAPIVTAEDVDNPRTQINHSKNFKLAKFVSAVDMI